MGAQRHEPETPAAIREPVRRRRADLAGARHQHQLDPGHQVDRDELGLRVGDLAAPRRGRGEGKGAGHRTPRDGPGALTIARWQRYGRAPGHRLPAGEILRLRAAAEFRGCEPHVITERGETQRIGLRRVAISRPRQSDFDELSC